ncbi:MAG: flagella basal body P-ring formation protein FlgA [Gammaproteobacteria bacterium]|nr:MAG: flagella basal body P-ring formation protein FlgA [Gammaproteobacteria bacterium]
MNFIVKTIQRTVNPAISGISLMIIVSSILSTNFAIANGIAQYENLANIRNTAKIFLEEMTNSADTSDVELNIGRLDPRLKLKKCEQPLLAFLPQGSKSYGKINIGVSCNGPVPWKIFISASKYHFQTVVIASNSLAKGKLISLQDLSYKRVQVNNFRKQPAIDNSQVVMTSARRFIRAGSIIYMNNICMICKGHKVSVSAGSKYFSINLEAEALADASVGETVRLRNFKSRRIFDGTVVGRNKAQVLLAN